MQRVDDPKNFREVATDAHRVGHGQADFLIGVDDKHRTHRGSFAFTGVDHFVHLRDFMIFVGDDRETQAGVLRVVHVFDPFQVFFHRVGRQAQRFDIAGFKLAGKLRCAAHFRGTDRGKVGGVAEEKHPGITGPVVEINITASGGNLEVRGGITKS